MSEKVFIRKNPLKRTNACKYFRQIKAAKQIMALNYITTQNPEPAPK